MKDPAIDRAAILSKHNVSVIKNAKLLKLVFHIQKQPFADVLQKSCKIHMKTPVPDSLFCRSETCNFLKKKTGVYLFLYTTSGDCFCISLKYPQTACTTCNVTKKELHP